MLRKERKGAELADESLKVVVGIIAVALVGSHFLRKAVKETHPEAPTTMAPQATTAKDQQPSKGWDQKLLDDYNARVANTRQSVDARFAKDRKVIVADIRQRVAKGDLRGAYQIVNEYAQAVIQNLTPSGNRFMRSIQPRKRKTGELLRRRVTQGENGRPHGDVHIGMMQEEVLTQGWGRPQSVDRTVTVHGTREQWVYPGSRNYLYFDDGVLTIFRTSGAPLRSPLTE